MKLYLILPSSETRIKAVMLPDEPKPKKTFKSKEDFDLFSYAEQHQIWRDRIDQAIEEAPFVKDQEQAVALLYADSRLVDKDHPYLIDGYSIVKRLHCDEYHEHTKKSCFSDEIDLVPIAKEEPKKLNTKKIAYKYMELPTYSKIKAMQDLGLYQESYGSMNLIEMDKQFFKTLKGRDDLISKLADILGIKDENPEPVESADNATVFKEAEVIRQIAEKILAVPENLKEHAADHKLITTVQILERFQDMVRRRLKAEPTEGNGGWISMDIGSPEHLQWYIVFKFGFRIVLAQFIDINFWVNGNIIIPDYYQPLPDTTKLTND